MGGCITKCCKDCIFKCRYGVKRGKFQELVTGRTPMINFMQTMKITTYEASRFIRLFEKIDEDHSGAIDIYEFFDFFDLDHSLFIKRSFLLMDFDRGNGEDDETDEVSKSKARMKEITKDTLSYEEFFVALYNYCTLDERGLAARADDARGRETCRRASSARARETFGDGTRALERRARASPSTNR